MCLPWQRRYGNIYNGCRKLQRWWHHTTACGLLLSLVSITTCRRVLFRSTSRCGSTNPWVTLSHKMVRFTSFKDQNVQIPRRVCLLCWFYCETYTSLYTSPIFLQEWRELYCLSCNMLFHTFIFEFYFFATAIVNV